MRLVCYWASSQCLLEGNTDCTLVDTHLMETLNITSNSISKQRRKLNMESYEKKADKNNITKNVIIPILFSVILLTGII